MQFPSEYMSHSSREITLKVPNSQNNHEENKELSKPSPYNTTITTQHKQHQKRHHLVSMSADNHGAEIPRFFP